MNCSGPSLPVHNALAGSAYRAPLELRDDDSPSVASARPSSVSRLPSADR